MSLHCFAQRFAQRFARRFALSLGLSLAMAPAYAQADVKADALVNALVNAALQGPPQHLPITAEWCLVNGPQVCIGLEVARSPQQQFMGLQRRPKLPPQRGMWFAFESPTPAYFWMYLTPEPLDMVFVSRQQVVAVVAQARPCLQLPCPNYGAGQPVDGVIELAGGEAARLGIVVGTQVVISPMVTPLPPSGR